MHSSFVIAKQFIMFANQEKVHLDVINLMILIYLANSYKIATNGHALTSDAFAINKNVVVLPVLYHFLTKKLGMFFYQKKNLTSDLLNIVDNETMNTLHITNDYYYIYNCFYAFKNGLIPKNIMNNILNNVKVHIGQDFKFCKKDYLLLDNERS